MFNLYPSTYLKAVAGVKTFFLTASLFAVQMLLAQSPLSFKKATLVSGEEGKAGAEYLFKGVVSNQEGRSITDCIVRIEAISQGVVLKNIDAATPGNEMAFQPVVEHQNTIGASSISFSFSFRPHQAETGAEQAYRFRQLAASLKGLKGFGDAQEFAECNIGNNSQVMFSSKNEDLLVARSGKAFRVENKWGVDTEAGSSKKAEKITFVDKEVEAIKLKFGVNSKMNVWAGTSMFNIVFSQQVPDISTAYLPTVVEGDMNLSLVSTRENNQPEALKKVKDESAKPAAELKQVEISVESAYVQDSLRINIPETWVAREVTIDIYQNNGEIIRKITEHEAAAKLSAEMFDLPAGSYLVRISCGKEYSLQHAIRTESL